MLKNLRKIFAMLTLAIAGFAIISQNYEVLPYMMFSQGAMMLVMGLDEMEAKRKKSGVLFLAVSLFSFYVGISTFLT